MSIDGKVVVVRHRKNGREYYLLPGGGVKYGETLGHALQREVVEETGFGCTVGRPLIINDTIDPNGSRHLVNITFACRVAHTGTGGQTADERIAGTELIEPSTLLDLDFRPPIAEQLVEALSDIDGFVAAYTGSVFVPEAASKDEQ